MAGYSGTPLPSKLGIRARLVVHLKDAPPDYLHLLEPLPEGVTFVPRISGTTDLVHVFSARKSELGAVTEIWSEITCPPGDRPWSVREMHVRHPAGHVFRISQGIEDAD
jgi:hypothetical protein